MGVEVALVETAPLRDDAWRVLQASYPTSRWLSQRPASVRTR